MNLIIPRKVENDFVNFIIDSMYEYLSDNLDPDRLVQAQLFVDSVNLYKSIYIPKIHVFSICRYPVFKTIAYNLFYKVEFDTNALVYGTLIKSVDIINLVNFGNMSVQPYPIFTQMFDYFNTNLSYLYNQFTFNIGG